MKRKMLLVGMVGFTGLFGCSQVTKIDNVEASVPSGYEIVEIAQEYSKKGWSPEVIEIKHKKTGCHYLYIANGHNGGFQQMFIEKNGVSVPYCEEE